jgi:hypothetical protein
VCASKVLPHAQHTLAKNTILHDFAIACAVCVCMCVGPILFLCYINDFFLATTLFSLLFADDTICLGSGKKLDDLTAYVNSELKKVANWFRSNKMAVNTSKTKFIVFRTRGKRIDPRECKLLFNTNEIGKTEDPNRIFEIKCIHNEGDEKSYKALGRVLII